MERRIGSVDMVRWQGRRIDPESRTRSRAVGLILTFAVISFISLAAGFYSGLPVPVDLLQTVSVILTIALGAYGVRLLIHALAARREGRSLRPYRR